jgi:hypothetical protein
MKKSEHFEIAMKAIIDNRAITVSDKIEVLATLMSERNIALMIEEREAERAKEAEGE